MGDERPSPNDPDGRGDPAHAEDNRWMHRPPMDWARAARRHDPGSLEGRAFAALRGLARARGRGGGGRLRALRSGGPTGVLPTGPPSVLGFRRVPPRSASFLSLTNFSDV